MSNAKEQLPKTHTYQGQHEAVLQLAMPKVNVTIMNTISGREAAPDKCEF